MADVICLSTKQVSPFLTLCLPCLRKIRFGVYGQGGWPPNIHAPSIPGSLVAQDPRLVGWDFSTYSSLCSWSCTIQCFRGKLFFGCLSRTQNEIQQLKEIRSFCVFSFAHSYTCFLPACQSLVTVEGSCLSCCQFL